MTRVTDEQFVREQWEPGAGFRYAGPNHGMIEVVGGRFEFNSGQFGNMDDFWTGAAEFTRTRLEQIRDVEEEIGIAMFCIADLKSMHKPAAKRILAREQAALADLKRGLRVAE